MTTFSGKKIKELFDTFNTSLTNSVSDLNSSIGTINEALGQFNKTLSTTIKSSSWEKSGSYYVTYISISGLTNNSIIEVTLPDSITDTQYDAWLNGVISTGDTASGRFTLKCRGVKPTVDIPIIVVYDKL